MSRHYTAARRDANHAEIVNNLRSFGVCVEDLASSGGGICDIVTHHAPLQTTVFIEIKCGAKAELKKTQIRFLGRWAGFCGIARNFEEALNLAVNPSKYGLTRKQKDKLLAFHATMDKPKVHLATIEKLLI